jgi:urocanate hydratase
MRRCCIQSGKPVGVFRTHEDAPAVLLANSNLVPKWATVGALCRARPQGLMMYGQMTAGSWIYIGSQGIVQGTYETFVEAGRQHHGGFLGWQVDLTAVGRHGRCPALAAPFAARVRTPSNASRGRIDFRQRSGYLERTGQRSDDALARTQSYTAQKKAVSIGLLGTPRNCSRSSFVGVSGRSRHRPDERHDWSRVSTGGWR